MHGSTQTNLEETTGTAAAKPGRGFSRRAFIAMATGYSPNSYVVDVDEDRGEVLVHVLRRVPRGEELT